MLLSSTGSSIISATNFTGNTASGLGGGLLLLQGDLLLNNTLWSNNTARVSGGAVAALQRAGQALVLSRSRFEGNAAAAAGAVYASQATVAALPGTSSTSGTLGDTLLSANDSAVARAASAAMRSSLWQFASYGGAWLDLFHLGAASAAGSAAKAEQPLVPKDTLLGLHMSTLVANEASNATGAAVQAAAGVVLVAAGSTLSDNSAVQHGGALACETCQGLLLLACNLTGNRAAGSGGAVYSRAARGRVDLRSVTLSGNAAEVAGGAACLLATADDVIVSNSVIVNNTAGPQGADTSADQASNSTAAASCAAEGGRGRASGCGGGLCVQPLSAVLVSESRIAGNSAAIGGGVLVEACGQGFGTCPVLLMNSSVETNAAVVGGGLYCTDARAVAVQGCGTSNGTAASAGTMLVMNGSALGTSANGSSGSGTTAVASNSSSSWVDSVLSALEEVVPVTSVFRDASAGLAAALPAGTKSAAYLAPFSSSGLSQQGECISAWGSNRAQGPAGYGATAAGTAAYLVANVSSEHVLLLSRNTSVAVQVGGWHGTGPFLPGSWA